MRKIEMIISKKSGLIQKIFEETRLENGKRENNF